MAKVNINYHILKELRKGTGFTQEDIAKRLSVSKRTYQSYEQGERKIPSDALFRLLNICHITDEEERNKILSSIYEEKSQYQTVEDTGINIPEVKETEKKEKNYLTAIINKQIDYPESFMETIVILSRLFNTLFRVHGFSIPTIRVVYYMLLKNVYGQQYVNKEFLKANKDYNIEMLAALITEYSEYVAENRGTPISEDALLGINRRMELTSSDTEKIFYKKQLILYLLTAALQNNKNFVYTTKDIDMDDFVHFMISAIDKPQKLGTHTKWTKRIRKLYENSEGETSEIFATGCTKICNYNTIDAYALGNDVPLFKMFFNINIYENAISSEKYSEFYKIYDGDNRGYFQNCPSRIYYLYVGTNKTGYEFINNYITYVNPHIILSEEEEEVLDRVKEYYENIQLGLPVDNDIDYEHLYYYKKNFVEQSKELVKDDPYAESDYIFATQRDTRDIQSRYYQDMAPLEMQLSDKIKLFAVKFAKYISRSGNNTYNEPDPEEFEEYM